MRGEDLEQLTNHKLGNCEHHPCPFQWRYQVPGRMSQRQCPFILDSNVTKGNIFFSIVVNWLSERDQITMIKVNGIKLHSKLKTRS